MRVAMAIMKRFDAVIEVIVIPWLLQQVPACGSCCLTADFSRMVQVNRSIVVIKGVMLRVKLYQKIIYMLYICLPSMRCTDGQMCICEEHLASALHLANIGLAPSLCAPVS